jgi:uncharacterized membrane protein YjdF
VLHHLRTRIPLIVGCSVIFLGIFVAEWIGLYTELPGVDKLFHFAGGFIVAWFALALLQDDIMPLSSWRQALILTSVACLIGVVWEFAEYTATLARTAHPLVYQYFHGGDLTDTLGDILADILGGFAFSVGALYKERS